MSHHDDYSNEGSEEEDSNESRSDSGSGSDYDDEAVEYESEESVGRVSAVRQVNTDIPLCERLKMIAEVQEQNALSSLNMKKKRKEKRSASREAEEDHRKRKNAPAVMPSNKPVKRLRVDANNSIKDFRDPRFSSVSGQLNEDKFMQAYDFLDKYQEDEVQKLQKALKKTKSPSRKEAIKEAFVKNKQELTERRRNQKIKQRMQEVKREEREKVADGKGAFFLKRSAKKAIAIEERFNELKKDGKLQKFMAKKRQKNANKDYHKMPSRRGGDDQEY